jgi:hypothetical protein
LPSLNSGIQSLWGDGIYACIFQCLNKGEELNYIF